MTTLSLAALVQVSLLTIGAEDYADAYRYTTETGRPLVVLVGADWCGPCQTMKNSVLPQIRERGILGKVAFAIVNVDQDRDLGIQLTNHGPIPQLLMFRKVGDGWRLRRLIGMQSVESVEGFLQEGIQVDTAEKDVKAETDSPIKAHLAAQSTAEAQVR